SHLRARLLVLGPEYRERLASTSRARPSQELAADRGLHVSPSPDARRHLCRDLHRAPSDPQGSSLDAHVLRLAAADRAERPRDHGEDVEKRLGGLGPPVHLGLGLPGHGHDRSTPGRTGPGVRCATPGLPEERVPAGWPQPPDARVPLPLPAGERRALSGNGPHRRRPRVRGFPRLRLAAHSRGVPLLLAYPATSRLRCTAAGCQRERSARTPRRALTTLTGHLPVARPGRPAHPTFPADPVHDDEDPT